jgi:hypothetical protein
MKLPGMARIRSTRIPDAKSCVDLHMAYVYVSQMKTLTIREFFHSPSLAKSIQPGQTLLVTSRGKPDLLVTKAGRARKKSAVEMRREAKALLSKPGKKVDTVALFAKLRR